MMSRRTVWGATALAAFVIGWWAAFFVGRGTQFAIDPVLYFYPLYAATWARIAEGQFPLWNPYQLCGRPWLGTLLGGLFYPTHVLYAVLPIPTAFAVSGILHLVVMAIATAVFVRRLGLGTAAAFLAAVVFALRGFGAFALVAPYFIQTISWLPVGAVAIVDLVRAPSRRAMALLALATGCSFLGGHPQFTVYSVYTWGSLALVLLIHDRPSIVDGARRIGAVATALALGGALGAVQLLPAMELARIGTRATGELAERVMLPFGPDLTLALLVFWRETITQAPFAFGVVVLGLVAAAVFAPGRRLLACWAIGVGVLAALWSLGRFTPLFDLYLLLPVVGWFRDPSRLLFVFDFCFAVAAAIGLTALLGPTEQRDTPRRTVWAASIAVIVGITLAVVGIRAGLVLPGRGTLGLAFAALGVLLVAAIPLVGETRRRALILALVVVATVEISRNPWGRIRLPYSPGDFARDAVLDRERDRLALRAGHDRVWQVRTGLVPVYALKHFARHRVRSLVDYEPVNLQRQANFFTYFTEGSTTPARPPWSFNGDMAHVTAPPGVPPVATRRRLLDLASVRWVTFLPEATRSPELAAFIEQMGLVPRPSGERFLVFENRFALPRAFVTYRARTAPESADAFLAALSRPTFDPLAESYVEGPPPLDASSDDAPSGHPATFVRDDEEVVELDVHLARPGLVVLADSYYPGWRATVDGVPAPIIQTNFLFRGVSAPAGAHRVRFVYEPASVRRGAVISLISLGLVVWLARRRPAILPGDGDA
jgi:hypothetical protein